MAVQGKLALGGLPARLLACTPRCSPSRVVQRWGSDRLQPRVGSCVQYLLPGRSGGRCPRLSRRRFLQLGGLGAVVVGGGFAGARLLGGTSPVGPGAAVVGATEAARRATGRVVQQDLRAGAATVDLGGRAVQTWAFNGTVPGPTIRVNAGDELRVRLANDLPDPTTVHWHGIALRNDMDGVPGLTMDPVRAGARFDYSFLVPDPRHVLVPPPRRGPGRHRSLRGAHRGGPCRGR